MRTPDGVPPADQAGRLRSLGPALALGLVMALTGVAAAALVVAVATGAPGGSQAAVDVSGPAEPLTRWGLPAVRTVRDLVSAAIVGQLVLVAVAVPGADVGRLSRPGERGVRLATAFAALWLPLALVTSVLRFAEFAGIPSSSPALGAQYVDYLLRFQTGRPELVALVATATLTTVLPLVRTLSAAAGAAGLALVALVPLAAGGHASAGDFSESATVTLGVHLAAVAIWVGGLLSLLMLRDMLGGNLGVVVQRFSRVAGVCWGMVAATGLANLVLALHEASDLWSVWGAALAAKVVLLLLLGALGWWHRRSTLPRLTRDVAAFRSWATGEVLLMAATLGVAVGVTASAPPPPDPGQDRTPLDMPWALLGFPAPAPLVPERWLTAGRLDLLWATSAAALVLVYLLGVRRLRRAGIPWAGRRTAAWLAGCSLLVYATSGAPGLYGRVDYSATVAQVLLLALAVAPLLAAARPGTLVALAVPARHDASRGGREWAAVAARSLFLARLSRPTVAVGLLVALVIGMSFSPTVDASVRTWPGHAAALALALAAGLLVARARDAGPLGRRQRGPSRRQSLAVLAGVFAASAALAVLRSAPIAAGWYSQVMRGAGAVSADSTGLLDAELLQSQVRGAAVVWAAAAIACLAGALIARGRRTRADRETGQHR